MKRLSWRSRSSEKPLGSLGHTWSGRSDLNWLDGEDIGRVDKRMSTILTDFFCCGFIKEKQSIDFCMGETG